jgi:hypothetical protein
MFGITKIIDDEEYNFDDIPPMGPERESLLPDLKKAIFKFQENHGINITDSNAGIEEHNDISNDVFYEKPSITKDSEGNLIFKFFPIKISKRRNFGRIIVKLKNTIFKLFKLTIAFILPYGVVRLLKRHNIL